MSGTAVATGGGVDRGTGAVGPAVVVFTDTTELWWLRLLTPGFRHCFVVLRRGGAWVVIDPLAHYTHVDLAPACLARSAEDIAAAYRAKGLIAVITEVQEPRRSLAPIRPFTCVEAVKRILGRRAPWVVTPWQLFRLLGESGMKFLEKEKNLDMTPGLV